MKNCNRCGKFRSQKNHVCLPVKVMKNGKVDYTFTMTPNIKGRMSRSERKKNTTKRPSRFISGAFVGLITLTATFFGLTSYANSETNTVTYQQTEQSISTSILPVATTTQKQDAKNILKTKKEIREYVLAQASSTGVWVAKIDHMVEHESHYDPKAIGDMQLICQYGKNKGKPVRARGIWQITDCGHPEITDEQAFDVKWSTAWALSVISKSQKDCRIQWTTCDGWYKI